MHKITAHHYSNGSKFCLEPVLVKNNLMWNKPMDCGLWCSPAGVEFGWKQWCEREEFPLGKYRFDFVLDVREIIVIDCIYDLDKLIWISGLMADWEVIDYEQHKLNGATGIWLTDGGEQETRHTGSRNMHGWDCESIFIMSERCIVSVTGPHR